MGIEGGDQSRLVLDPGTIHGAADHRRMAL
jgi:hypothetical protein